MGTCTIYAPVRVHVHDVRLADRPLAWHQAQNVPRNRHQRSGMEDCPAEHAA